jgi:hypothetical protein
MLREIFKEIPLWVSAMIPNKQAAGHLKESSGVITVSAYFDDSQR